MIIAELIALWFAQGQAAQEMIARLWICGRLDRVVPGQRGLGQRGEEGSG